MSTVPGIYQFVLQFSGGVGDQGVFLLESEQFIRVEGKPQRQIGEVWRHLSMQAKGPPLTIWRHMILKLAFCAPEPTVSESDAFGLQKAPSVVSIFCAGRIDFLNVYHAERRFVFQVSCSSTETPHAWASNEAKRGTSNRDVVKKALEAEQILQTFKGIQGVDLQAAGHLAVQLAAIGLDKRKVMQFESFGAAAFHALRKLELEAHAPQAWKDAAQDEENAKVAKCASSQSSEPSAWLGISQKQFFSKCASCCQRSWLHRELGAVSHCAWSSNRFSIFNKHCNELMRAKFV